MKPYNKAPLPFQGQKRNFIKQFREVIKNYPNIHTVVDLFGGSGLLSHNVKRIRPELKVIYNDFDNYRWRLEQIPRTNEVIKGLQRILTREGEVWTKSEMIPQERAEEIKQYLKEEAKKSELDWLTISSNIMFAGNVAESAEDLKNTKKLYYKATKVPYDADGYLDGLDVVSKDYKELIEQYKEDKGVLFLLDPPYLSTDCGAYHDINYWTLKDYLDILLRLENKKYVYFTSNKSSLLELGEWLGENPNKGNIFKGTTKYETINRPIGKCKESVYTDIMLVK